MFSEPVLNCLTNRLIGAGEERTKALALFKKQPEKVKQIIGSNMMDLTTTAAFQIGEIVVVEDTEEAVEFLFNHITTRFAEELKAIPT